MKEAILQGVAETGKIISTAGIIMAIAFGGLLIPPIASLNESALIFVTSVLFDTFVVRTMLVPCFLFVFGDLNWWPVQKDPGLAFFIDRGFRLRLISKSRPQCHRRVGLSAFWYPLLYLTLINPE